ncbi:hypothetical protein SN31241_2660 [Salmonella enterica subsp. enterica serovar Newport str. USMARC-S3124.1]|nr:hypothetical protein SN31241_2660 [Salmonella enterica subsp. enterica serovar Newport str. USMARC-S3124.1]
MDQTERQVHCYTFWLLLFKYFSLAALRPVVNTGERAFFIFP